MLAEAAELLPSPAPAVSVVTDSGVEDLNSTVDDALGSGPLRRVKGPKKAGMPNYRAGKSRML
jgi:hypothetical protein